VMVEPGIQQVPVVSAATPVLFELMTVPVVMVNT
jgi:hypothetical protein